MFSIDDSLLDEESKEILGKCYVSTEALCKVLFPERFFMPFSTLHRDIFDVVDDRSIRQAVVSAPRGLGKTSIVALALLAWAIIFRESKFIVYVSNSATNAELQTENLKSELLSNRVVRTLFGDIRADKFEGVDETFSKKAWVANGETLILPRGSGQQVRGLLFKNSRPDLIVVDDLEDTETINSEVIRHQREEWFFSDLCKSVPQFSGASWRILYIDTLKHEASLLAKLLKMNDWKHVQLAICDENYQSLAPEFVTTEQIMSEVEAHREAGTLDVFYREKMGLPISTEDAVFRTEYFKYYDDNGKDFNERLARRKIENLVIVDPAKTSKMHSADSAIVGWGVDLEENKWYLRDVDHGKMHPHELYDRTLNMASRLDARVIGIEVTSLNEFITFPFRNAMSERGLNFEIIELKARRGSNEYMEKGRGKEGRVAALVPFYKKGQIFHNKAVSGVMEQQLLSFPRSAKWDVMDAAAYIVEILEMGLRYFMPVDSGDDDPKLVEAEYADLYDEEDVVGISWMRV